MLRKHGAFMAQFADLHKLTASTQSGFRDAGVIQLAPASAIENIAFGRNQDLAFSGMIGGTYDAFLLHPLDQ